MKSIRSKNDKVISEKELGGGGRHEQLNIRTYEEVKGIKAA